MTACRLAQYIDDILRPISLVTPTDAVPLSGLEAAELDIAIHPRRYAQNTTKAEFAPWRMITAWLGCVQLP